MVKRNWKAAGSWTKKTLLTLGIGLCIAGMGAFPSQAASQKVGTVAGHPIFDNEFCGAEIEDGSDTTLTRRAASFAAKYDPRTTKKVSNTVEDQGNTNTCWAFSTIAAIESNLIKKGYENENVNLSENHLAYFFYNRATDPVGYTAGDANLNTNSTWAMNGGTLQGTALTLATWSGVVKETTSEDDAGGAYSPKALAASACYKSDYKVANTYFFNYSVNTVKQAIMDYGAVASGIYMDNSYWNLTTGAYYCPESNGNHAVAIVGWDDNYSRLNFNSSSRPKSNGAWIVKNSYGTTYQGKPLGDYGYMYVSYEDASLREIVAYDMVKASETYDNNYQYDGTGNPAFSLRLSSGTTCANVFKTKASKSGYNEILKAVGVDVLTTNVKYSLQVYTGVTSSSNPTKGKAMFSKPQTGTLTEAGYNQIVLNSPVTLTAGEKYSVVIKLSAADGSSVSMACESQYNAGWISFKTAVGKAQGYIYTDKKWYDCGDYRDMGSGNTCNLRIKAYTDNTTQKTTYKLSSKTLGISKGSSATLSLKISPSSVKRKVTWTSSNTKVATVSSSGKVKAKAYGTATIKAKFVAGSKTKTLSCKVTVGPSKIKSFKVTGGKKKITVRWKKNNAASGYVIYYSKSKSSGYKALATITSNTKTKYIKKKMKKGTYYVKMRPYLTKSGKKLYGSYTAVKKVTVK